MDPQPSDNQSPQSTSTGYFNPSEPAPQPVQQAQPASLPPVPPTPEPVKKPKKKNKIGLTISTIVASLIAGFGGAWIFSAMGQGQLAMPALQSSGNGNAVIDKDGSDVSAVAKSISPSVVSIVAGDGAGTGIIVSKDGYIMTNDHVVKKARDFQIVTDKGETYDKVSFVGFDPLNDIAFLKIRDVDNLPVAKLGDSGSLSAGQPVVAVGNALGQYSHSITSGVVSGLGRPLIAADATGQDAEQLSDLIQTDAAINSGNSGGPLVNMAGEVIGVNVAMAQDANTVGFAIPINAAKGVIASVLDKGKVERAYLGVHYLDITPDILAKYDLPVKNGAFVRDTGGERAAVSGGPAAKAGLRDGDIITRINKEKIGERGELVSIIGQYRPGDSVELRVLRKDKQEKLTVKLGDYSKYVKD